MAKKLGMSVLAASLLATGGFAADNITDAFKNAKVNGELTVFYQSMENAAADKDLFKQNASAADVGLKLGVTTEALDGFVFTATMYGVDTLGLENHMVSAIMVSPDAATDNDNDGPLNQLWWGEMNFAKTMGKTTVKMGRQQINTPLCNSDTWNVHPNTFDAIVAINQDIPNLILVGAYVGNERATVAGASAPYSVLYGTNATTGAQSGLLGASKTNGKYNTFFEEGAYAAAAIFTGIENTPIRLFYYDVTYIAQAMYADVATKVAGVDLAAQYMSFTPARYVKAVNDESTTAFGIKASGKVAGFGLMGAYTSVSSDGILAAANVADGQTKTPLYSATIIGDADVAGRPGTKGMKVSVSHDLGVKGLNLALNYGSYDHDEDVETTDSDSTSTELVAKYAANEHTKLFVALASYDHIAGYAAGKADTAENFFRTWVRFNY